MIEIEITNRCNLSCPYCIRRVDKFEERDMTSDEFNHILKELLTIQGPKATVALSGLGEPLLNPHLTQMLNNPLLKKFQHVNFSTNATLLMQETIKQLIDVGSLWLINVSLQSTRKEVMETLQRGAKFEQIVTNIQNLIRYAYGKRTYIRIQHLRTSLNLKETKADFEKLLEVKLGVKNILFQSKGVTPTSMGMQLPKEAYNLMIKNENNKPIYIRPGGRPWACKMLYARNIIISAHGDLTGCCWDTSRLQTYGNIFETSLRKLRSSKTLKIFRQELMNRDFHRLPICKRCLSLPLV